jgi:hypothetical protein
VVRVVAGDFVAVAVNGHINDEMHRPAGLIR